MIKLDPCSLDELPEELIEAIEYHKSHPEFGTYSCRDNNKTNLDVTRINIFVAEM